MMTLGRSIHGKRMKAVQYLRFRKKKYKSVEGLMVLPPKGGLSMRYVFGRHQLMSFLLDIASSSSSSSGSIGSGLIVPSLMMEKGQRKATDGFDAVSGTHSVNSGNNNRYNADIFIS